MYSITSLTFQDYWKFTWDEMAKYDLPSSLNFVLSHTGIQGTGYRYTGYRVQVYRLQSTNYKVLSILYFKDDFTGPNLKNLSQVLNCLPPVQI